MVCRIGSRCFAAWSDRILGSGLAPWACSSLARIGKRGLVERQVSARCRREKHVSLTPAGEGAYQGVQRILEEWGHVKYQGFTPEERALNEAFLTRIAENVIEFCRGEGSEHG